MTREDGKRMVEEALKEIPSISCEDYAHLRRGGADVVLLDVREESEWEAGHLEEAVHIPRGLLEMKVEKIIPDKHQPIVLCCAKGGRAALAAKTLLEMNYSDLKYLEGGYQGYCSTNGE